MMQFYMGNILLIGVTSGNIKKLQEGLPIYIRELQSKEPIEKLAIIYGEDKPTILKKLHEELDFEIPDWMQKAAEDDPS